MSDLSFQQRNFINEYFVDFNGTRAAERAGYKGDDNSLAVTASRLLRNAKVKELIEKRFRASCMSADEALFRLGQMARADAGKYIDVHGIVDWAAIKEDGVLFKEITHVKGHSSFKMHDAQAALNTILKHHGALVNRHEHTGKDGGPIKTEDVSLTDEQRVARVMALLDAASTKRDSTAS